MNKHVHKTEESRDKLFKILENFKENTTTKTIKIPKNFPLLVRKLYKYIKENNNMMNINFNELEQIDKEKQ
jgi:hypothetical protein